jgi:hypothetical protein
MPSVAFIGIAVWFGQYFIIHTTPRRATHTAQRHQPQAQPPGVAAGGAGVSSGSSSA